MNKKPIENEAVCAAVSKRQFEMKGFSMVELVIVVVMLAIISAFSIPYLFQHRRLYKAEEQTLKTMI